MSGDYNASRPAAKKERAEIVNRRTRADVAKAQKQKPVMARPKQTARELYQMAKDAREGIPPAMASADKMIRDAEQSGDFTRARKLRDEVKERAGELLALAKAQEKRERRAKRAKE